MGKAEYDQQIKDSFSDLQKKMSEAKHLMAAEEERKHFKARQKEATGKMLEKIQNIEGPVYRQIGRAFVISTVEAESKRLTGVIGDYETEIKTAEERIKYIQKSVNDAQNNVREMLASRK